MKHTLFRVGLLLMIISLVFVAPTVQAGGWAAVTLDSLPVAPRAGEEIRIGFTIRQHGVTPINTARPYLEAENEATGESLRVAARQEGAVGHFIVDVTFPSAGSWRWAINLESFGGFPDYFEALTVLPPAANSSTTPLWPGGLILIILGGLAFAMQRGAIEKKAALAIGAASVIVLVGGLLIWPTFTLPATQKTSADSQPPITEYGRALFVAKGCLACHLYQGITDSVPGPIIGPNLTDYQANPASPTPVVARPTSDQNRYPYAQSQLR